MIRLRGLLLACAAAAAVGFISVLPFSAGAQGRPPGEGAGMQRRQLEQRFRERVGAVVQRRLGLNANQMSRLQTSNRQFEQRRIDLLMRERETRRELRRELLAGEGANQTRVGQLLDETMRFHRQRLDLAESEQRELAKFLTPVQRAKYFGLQNEIRQRAQELGKRGVRPGQKRRRAAGQNAPPGL